MTKETIIDFLEDYIILKNDLAKKKALVLHLNINYDLRNLEWEKKDITDIKYKIGTLKRTLKAWLKNTDREDYFLFIKNDSYKGTELQSYEIHWDGDIFCFDKEDIDDAQTLSLLNLYSHVRGGKLALEE